MVTFTLLGSIFSILLILSIFALTLSLSRDSSEKDRERISAAALSAQITLSVGSFCLAALSILMQNAIKFESILPVKILIGGICGAGSISSSESFSFFLE
jgi:uncharacterized membrane protein YdcZ (DUF606 family)